MNVTIQTQTEIRQTLRLPESAVFVGGIPDPETRETVGRVSSQHLRAGELDLLAEGYRATAEMDRELAEGDMAAGAETLLDI